MMCLFDGEAKIDFPVGKFVRLFLFVESSTFSMKTKILPRTEDAYISSNGLLIDFERINVSFAVAPNMSLGILAFSQNYNIIID